MAPQKILIISQLLEPSTEIVAGHLQEMGAEVVRVNSEEAVLSASWTVLLDGERRGFELTSANGVHRSEDICAVWHRRWAYPIYPQHFDEATKAFCFNELSSLVAGLSTIAQNVRWVNDLSAERRAANKLHQLHLASEIGLRIPRTIVTSNARTVELIASEWQVPIIFKPVSGSTIPYRAYNDAAFRQLGEKYPDLHLDYGLPATGDVLYTQPLDSEKLGKLGSLHWSPAIFQERINKRADVRVTVVGAITFAALIHSQDDLRTSVDFRRMNQGIQLAHESIILPDHVESGISQMMNSLGLEFGCFDFAIDDKTGDYVFFEVNPSGQWLWVEQLTGMQISHTLAEHLLYGSHS